jgi:serine/threonine protein kinase
VPNSGDEVDDYKLGALLSDGFYSRVFVAEDRRDGNRRLVVKFPKPRIESDQNIRQAVVRERWLSGKLHSAIILAPLSLDGERQSRLYVVMPYCEGMTLEKLIEKGPVNLSRGLKIAAQLGAAIQALNRLNVFHRDIKPENVLLTKAGELRLLDLGFSYMPGMLAPSPTTPPGSPAYMAPELMRGQLGDRRSEVFAFGVTLYRVFSGGRLPYGLNGRVPLARHCPDLPPWLDSVLEKAMHNDPESRYQDVVDVCSDLVRYAASGGETPSLRRAPLIARNPLLFWQVLAATLLVLLLAALAHVKI